MTDAIDILINATDKASPAIGAVKSSLGGMSEEAGKSSSALGGVGNILSNGLAVAATAGAAAIGGLIFAFRDSADIARQHMQVETQLATVLKSTGGAAGVTAEMANKLADSLGTMTNFDDEAVLSGENLLLTFTGIGKDVFPRATETMLDMSQALGQDMKSSAVQLGKALNDPIAGITALSRVGVSFTDQQKDQIKTMVEAGNTAGAQGIILDELAKEFGGSAKAMAEPGKQLANMWDNLKEVVGTFILPILDDLAKRAMPLVGAATDYLSGLLGIFNDHLSKGESYVDAFHAVIKAVVPSIKEWTAAMWKWVVDSIPIVLQKLGEWGGNILTWLVNALPGVIKTFLEWETALYQWIDDTLPKAISALANFVRGLRGEGDTSGGSAMSSMASGWAGKLWRWITDELIPAVGPAFTKFVSTMARLGMDLLRSLGDLAVELGKTLWHWIVEITPVALKALADWGGALWDWIKEHAPSWKDKLLEWAGLAWQWIRDVAIPNALEQLGKWGVALWGWVKENAPKWRENLILWQAAAWQWVLDSIPIVLSKLKEWGTELIDWVKESWPGWRDSLLEAGRNVIQGFVDGIKKRWSELVESVASIPRDFVDNLKYDLGIHSPSSVMYDIGTNISQGLVDGIASYASQFEESGRSISNGVAAGLRSQVDVIAAQVKSAMDLASATLQGQIDTMNRQAAVKAQQSYMAAVAAASSPANVAAVAKAMGINPAFLPASMGGTGQVVGVGPNGSLIMAPQNNAPMSTNLDAGKPTLNNTVALLDAMNNWKNFFLSSKDPLNDFLASINKLAPTTTQAAQDAIKQWLQTWKDTKDPLNDFFVQAQNAVRQIYDIPGVTASGGNNIGNQTPYYGETATPEEVIKTLGESLGLKDVATTIQQSSVGLLGGINLVSTDVAATQAAIKEANKDAKKVVNNFVGGLTDFINDTLKGSSVAFDKLSTDSIAAFDKGQKAWQKWLSGNEGGMRSAITDLFYDIRDELTTIMGHTSDALQTATPDNAASVQLFLGAAKEAISSINSKTDMSQVQKLLQNLVDYRSLTNNITGNQTFANVLPNDPRLTGNPNAVSNQYNITLQGSNNANTDILSLIQMLGSLQGASTP